jgi:hypothetical protein
MIVLIHVLIALSSVGFSTYLVFRPSNRNFYINYSLIGMTFATGIYLVWSTHSPLLQSCISGLVYLGLVSFITAAAQYRRVIRNESQ